MLNCGCENGICAECYGKLPGGDLPEVGYPAGLLAAQSIGERGTQLSMKSAHESKSQVNIDSTRNLIGAKDKRTKQGKIKIRSYEDFYVRLCGSRENGYTPYHELDPRHIQLLWRVLSRYPGNSLNEALKDVDEGGDAESIARSANLKVLEKLLNGEMRDIPLGSPSAQVMFNSFEEGV